jgi:hypothetical protein
MKLLTQILTVAMILGATSAHGAPEQATISEAIVPVVGTIVGLGAVEWRADVALRNDQPYPVEVVLSLVGVPGDPFYFTTLGPGDSLMFPDISRQTFGVVGRLSPLRIQTLAPASVNVAAVAYGLTPEGPTEPQVLTVQYGRLRPLIQTLPYLEVSDVFRTNVGLANPGEQRAMVVLALQQVAGFNIGVVTLELPPGSFIQLPIQSLFPLLSAGKNLQLVIEQSVSEAYAYASVVANATNNGRYYGPR